MLKQRWKVSLIISLLTVVVIVVALQSRRPTCGEDGNLCGAWLRYYPGSIDSQGAVVLSIFSNGIDEGELKAIARSYEDNNAVDCIGWEINGGRILRFGEFKSIDQILNSKNSVIEVQLSFIVPKGQKLVERSSLLARLDCEFGSIVSNAVSPPELVSNRLDDLERQGFVIEMAGDMNALLNFNRVVQDEYPYTCLASWTKSLVLERKKDYKGAFEAIKEAVSRLPNPDIPSRFGHQDSGSKVFARYRKLKKLLANTGPG